MNSTVNTDTVIGDRAQSLASQIKVTKVDKNEDLLMKALVLVVIVAATLGVTANTALPNASSKSAVPGKDHPVLELFINTSKVRYKITDQFQLHVNLKNVSANDYYVFGRLAWGYSGTLMFFIYDSTGKEVEPKLIPDEPPFAPSDDNSDYVKLRPAHSLGITYFAPVRLMNLTRGRYSVVVKYQCLFPQDAVKVQPFWGKEKGILSSNVVQIEVLR